MEELKKMVMAVANSIGSLRSEMLKRFDKQDEKIEGVNKKMDVVKVVLTTRIDKLGLELADLSDDAPTIDEFEKLEKRVGKLEHQIASSLGGR